MEERLRRRARARRMATEEQARRVAEAESNVIEDEQERKRRLQFAKQVLKLWA